MSTLTSRALASKEPAAVRAKRAGICSRPNAKWLLFGAAILTAAGLAFGSATLGVATFLPLLYTLPCLLMVAMCMRTTRKGTEPSDDNPE